MSKLNCVIVKETNAQKSLEAYQCPSSNYPDVDLVSKPWFLCIEDCHDRAEFASPVITVQHKLKTDKPTR